MRLSRLKNALPTLMQMLPARLSGQCNRPHFTGKSSVQALRGDHALCFASISTCWIDQRQPVGLLCLPCQQSGTEPTDAAVEMARYNPNACVAASGTVDTALSKPFRAHVPEGSLFTVEDSATMMWSVLNRLAGGLGFSPMMANLFPIEGLIDVASTT